MISIGVRCSNKDYALCVISGDRSSPTIITTKHVEYPADFTESEILRWLYQEMQAVFREHGCDEIAIKKAEPSVRRSNNLEVRIQAEGIVAFAAAESGCNSVCRKVKSTIAKDLGLKGKAKYLETKLDTSPIPNFKGYPLKIQEALIAAWSCK